MGRWQNDSFSGSYQTFIPVEGVVKFAGFQTKSEYHIPRDLIDPPPQLLTKIFPELESLEKKYWDIEERHISGKGFILIMKFIRKVVLQDVALMELDETIFKNFSLFKSPIFQVLIFLPRIFKIK